MDFTSPETYAFLTQLAEIIVPSVTTLAAFFLGKMDTERISKKEVMQKRMDDLYIPFYRMYCANMTNKYSLISKDPTIRRSFLTLFEKNIDLMDELSQKRYIPLRASELILTSAENGMIEFSVQEELNCFSSLFNDMCDSMLKEYTLLCSKLKLPKPAITKREDYSF